ncbi:hypothetical protein [Leptospira santarosai]|uniref:hypothetical protein n=1 Tax=Leptospira santarosai TaxID=28183 RepID=UPI0007742636|nr:hypothetical protein [Leptospira santarosai]
MRNKIKRRTTFLAMLGMSAVLFCTTVMLSGNHCPSFGISDQTNLPPCHRSEKANKGNACSVCNLFASSESVHPKTPELNKNYFSVLTSIQNLSHFTLGIFFSQRNSYDRNPDYNSQKFALQFISTVRLLI